MTLLKQHYKLIRNLQPSSNYVHPIHSRMYPGVDRLPGEVRMYPSVDRLPGEVRMYPSVRQTTWRWTYVSKC